MVNTKRRQESARRAEIVAIAAEIFGEQGYQATTMRDIADRADVLSGSLYYHFDSKESLLNEIVVGYLEHLVESYETIVNGRVDAANIMAELVNEAVMSSTRHRSEVLILHNDWHYLVRFVPFLDKAMSQVEELWTNVIRLGIDQGAFRDDLDPDLVYRTMMGAISWVVRWYTPTGTATIEKVALTQKEVLLTGIMRSVESP